MKIGMLSTVGTNIGDDFIRIGIQYLLSRSGVSASSGDYVVLNKHRPFGAIFPEFDRYLCKLPNVVNLLCASAVGGFFGSNFSSSIDDCDLIIQCGTPIIWHGCASSEWADFVWKGLFRRLVEYRNKPLLNIAGGSCFAWREKDGVVLSPKDCKFVELMANLAMMTTVRDPLAKRIFGQYGNDVDLLPCPAFFANRFFDKEKLYGLSGNKGLAIADVDIVFNYMPGAGHYDFGKLNYNDLWLDYFKKIYHMIRLRGYRTAFVCHSMVEVDAAKIIDPSALVLIFESPKDYLLGLSSVKFAFVNRLHASVALGGSGIPSIAVGTDTRMLMVGEFGIPYYWVGALPKPIELMHQIENLMQDHERQRLVSLSVNLEKCYIDLFRDVLGKFFRI